MTTTDVKLDTDRAWVKAAYLGKIVVLSVLATAGYLDLKYSIADGAKNDAALVASVREVRDELRRMSVDFVSTRQFQQFIEMQRATNRDKYSAIQWNDLPR